LDLLRLIAALGVVLAHWTWSPEWVHANFQGNPMEVFGNLSQLSRYGFLGVPISFMISGAVVIRSAINKNPVDFLKARAVRILPLYYLALSISAGVKFIFGEESVSSIIRDSVKSALLVVPISGANWLNPVFWTLSLEVQFYLIIVCAVLFFKIIKISDCFIPFAFLALCFIPQIVAIPIFSSLQLIAYLPFFLIGIVASSVQSRKGKFVAVAYIFILCLQGTRSLIRSSDMSNRSGSTIFLVLLFTSLFLVGSFWILKLRMLYSKRLLVLGLMTYPIYLFHVQPARLFLSWLLSSGVPSSVSFGLVFFTLIWFCYLLTMRFEPQIAKLLKRIKLILSFNR